MRHVALADAADLSEWRVAARTLLAEGIAPDQVCWDNSVQGDLLQGQRCDAPAQSVSQLPRVPREFIKLAELVLAHADARRHAVLYRLLWRLVHGESTLLRLFTDTDVAWSRDAARAVSREKHKMKAFVRFREVNCTDGTGYIAWFEPTHDVLPLITPFFMRRFASMRWSILTPTRSAHWDGQQLHSGPGGSRADAPDSDAQEDLWRVYYASIFNPARLKVSAMVKEMPVRYWKNLPEATLIPSLILGAGTRMQTMLDAAPTHARKRLPAAARKTRSD